MQKNMVCCSQPGCDVVAHAHRSGENKRFIFKVPSFSGKTCFEIAHDSTFRGMFTETNNFGSRQKKQLTGDIEYMKLFKNNI